ncbi:MAG TPA: hypothetical protein VIM81_02215 [Gammaproteobacteria bacterium]
MIDAEVAACASPTDGIDAAIAEWEQAVGSPAHERRSVDDRG